MIVISGPTGAPGIAYIHTDAPKSYHPSPKTAQQLQQLGQINVNSNSHYMAQNPFIVNQQESPASTAHRLLRTISWFPIWTSVAATFSLEPQSRRLEAWREISIRWAPVICGDIACPWSLLLINSIPISQNDYWTYNPTTERSVVKTYSPFKNSVCVEIIAV